MPPRAALRPHRASSLLSHTPPSPELLALRAALFAAAGVSLEGCIQEPSDPTTDREPSAGATAGATAGVTAGVTAGATSGVTPPPPELACEMTPTYLPDGRPTGYARCDDGRVFKVGPSACLSGSCASDSDCAGGAACLCPTGEGALCVTAECVRGSQCDTRLCEVSQFISGDFCVDDFQEIACRSEVSACLTHADCDADNICIPMSDSWDCVWTGYNDSCGVGRAALSDAHEALLAPLTERGGWGEPGALPLDLTEALRALTDTERERLRREWSSLAAFEHASVASFARATLELMSLGAPADLLLETQRAAADEVEHARAVYALLTALTHTPAAPGPLATDRLTPRRTRREVALGLLEEACVSEALGVGEVIYALELTGALGAPREVRDHLSRVCADETRHAALAWATLRWLVAEEDAESVEGGAALRAELWGVLLARLSELLSVGEGGAGSPALNRLGVLTPAQRWVGRARVAGAVEACAREVLGGGRRLAV